MDVAKARFSDTDPVGLLLRPAGQIALTKGLALAVERSQGQLSVEEAIRRANKVDWTASKSGYWSDVIIRPSRRMDASRSATNLGGELLAYLIGKEYMTNDQRDNLRKTWNERRGKDVITPESQIKVKDDKPEDLPAAIK